MMPNWLVSTLLIAAVNGAVIPRQTSSLSPCISECFEKHSDVLAANDLANFATVAANIDEFCDSQVKLSKCGAACGKTEEAEVMARLQAPIFICNNKVEDMRTVAECLKKTDDEELLDGCFQRCEIHESTSWPLAGADTGNPAYTEQTCTSHRCVLKCSAEKYNEKCAGTGDLFLDIARQQVVDGAQRLLEVSPDNLTNIESVLVGVLRNLPEKCQFVVSADKFDEDLRSSNDSKAEVGPNGEETKDSAIEESSGEETEFTSTGTTMKVPALIATATNVDSDEDQTVEVTDGSSTVAMMHAPTTEATTSGESEETTTTDSLIVIQNERQAHVKGASTVTTLIAVFVAVSARFL